MPTTFGRLLLRAALAAGLSAALLAGCGGGSGAAGGAANPPPVDPPPVATAAAAITSQPLSQTVTVGAAATLTVAASGGALSYQWTRNGADVAGATSASYTLQAVQAADSAAVWRVQVRNALGSATSQPVMLTVGGTGMRPIAGLVDEKPAVATEVGPGAVVGIIGDGKGGFYLFGGGIQRMSAGGQLSLVSGENPCSFYQGALDKGGNLYVPCRNAIYKMTPAGAFTLVAGARDDWGYVDGIGAAARFSSPTSLAVDSKGVLYVSDAGSLIRKIDQDGRVTTFAGDGKFSGEATDGVGTAASFAVTKGLAFDAQDLLYVLDLHAIRTVTPAGQVRTFAGKAGRDGAGWIDGPRSSARFNYPWGLSIDTDGTIYIADTTNAAIRKIGLDGQVSTVAGNPVQTGSADGIGGMAAFNAPFSVAVGDGGNLYVADTFNNTIRKVTQAGLVTTLVGTPVLPRSSGSVDGLGQEARFYLPGAMTVDAAGNVLVSDAGNHIVRKISPSGQTSRLAGRPDNPHSIDGSGYGVGFTAPGDLALDGVGNILVLDEAIYGGRLRKLTPGGTLTTVPMPSDPLNRLDPHSSDEMPALPSAIAADRAGSLYVSTSAHYSNSFCTPDIPCYSANRVAVRRIAPDGTVTTLADTPSDKSPGSLPSAVNIRGLAVDAAGNVYVADTRNHRILKIAASGAVSTLAGGSQGAADGQGAAASFSSPSRVVVGAAGNVYVLDSGNITVRKITPDGTVTTVAGTAGKNQLAMDTLPGSLTTIGGIALDAGGNLFISVANGVIRIAKP